MSRGTFARMAWQYTIADYVRLEASSPIKHEYVAGEIRVMGGAFGTSMGGGTIEHARIAATITRLLGNQLVGRACAVYSSDARVRIVASDVITYPDVTISCGHVELDPGDSCALLNPTVVVEVTSPSSEEYDRGGKLDLYKTIASVRAVVIVSHRERSVEVHRRVDDGSWSRLHGTTGQPLTIEAIGCELDVDAIYHHPLAAS
jgi:Uma2 family endonuclease